MHCSDLYDEKIDAMKAREPQTVMFVNLNLTTLSNVIAVVWNKRRSAQHARNAARLAAYKRKRTATALTELQRLGQEWDNG